MTHWLLRCGARLPFFRPFLSLSERSPEKLSNYVHSRRRQRLIASRVGVSQLRRYLRDQSSKPRWNINFIFTTPGLSRCKGKRCWLRRAELKKGFLGDLPSVSPHVPVNIALDIDSHSCSPTVSIILSAISRRSIINQFSTTRLNSKITLRNPHPVGRS